MNQPSTSSTRPLIKKDDMDMFFGESIPLKFSDIIPYPHLYDKMRPPKIDGGPTKVNFHVTVMGLDTIDEYSMVRYFLEISGPKDTIAVVFDIF